MSVKFQETVQTKVTDTANVANTATAKVKETLKESGYEDLSHRLGEYLTGGDTGQGYLAVCDIVFRACYHG